jgi:hypothetical protein
MSQPGQFPPHHFSGPRRHQVPARIRCIVADTFFIRIDFQHIFRPIRIMLKAGQGNPTAPPLQIFTQALIRPVICARDPNPSQLYASRPWFRRFAG